MADNLLPGKRLTAPIPILQESSADVPTADRAQLLRVPSINASGAQVVQVLAGVTVRIDRRAAGLGQLTEGAVATNSTS